MSTLVDGWCLYKMWNIKKIQNCVKVYSAKEDKKCCQCPRKWYPSATQPHHKYLFVPRREKDVDYHWAPLTDIVTILTFLEDTIEDQSLPRTCQHVQPSCQQNVSTLINTNFSTNQHTLDFSSILCLGWPSFFTFYQRLKLLSTFSCLQLLILSRQTAMFLSEFVNLRYILG